MGQGQGVREVGYADCPGGGQVYVDGTTAYIGHIKGPEATSVIDVSDPKNPKTAKEILCKHSGSHSHKVRVQDGIMLTNYESIGYAGVACGTPIVASDIGPNAELIVASAPDDSGFRVGEAGVAARTGSAEAFAAAIDHMMGRPALREALGRRARELAVERFSLARFERDLRLVYEDVLGGGGSTLLAESTIASSELFVRGASLPASSLPAGEVV